MADFKEQLKTLERELKRYFLVYKQQKDSFEKDSKHHAAVKKIAAAIKLIQDHNKAAANQSDTKVGSAEDLKLQGQQVLEGGLAELKGGISSSDFMELFDKTLTNFGNIFNEGIPALEKTGEDVSAVTEAVKKNQDAFEQAFALRAAEIVNLEADQLLEAGLAELKETAPADMDKLFDKTLTHFGTIFNEVLPELDSLSVDTSKMMDYTKAKQDEFEKAFEAKKGGGESSGAPGSAEDLKLQGQQVLEGGLAEIKGDISSSKFMELFDKTLTNFGNIFNEGIPALEKTGVDVSAVTEAIKKNQDAFEQAFAVRAAEIVNLEADQLLEAGLAELKETAAADMDKLFDKTLTHFGTIFNEVLPELDSLSVDTSKMMDYTKGKQDEFEKAFEAKKGGGESSGAPGSAEDLKLQGQQVLEGGLAELKGDLSSSDFMELFDKTLTNFGNIFNEGIPALEKTGADVSAVTEAVKKNQDEFEQAFALRAAEIVNLEADQILEAGLAELKETAAADMDKLFDKTLTHFGTIFNEVLPELDSLSVDTSKMMDYTKGKQDEFEKAFEAKKGGGESSGAPGSAEDLKLQGQQVLEGGLAELKGDLSSSDFMELFDKTLTNFGNIFNEGIPALEKTGADVSAVTEAVKKNQDAFEQAFALRAAEIVKLEADQLLEAGLAELKETAAADMDKLFDKTLTHFGTIFNEVLPELDSLSVDTSKMMDYTKGKQDEFEKAFEAKKGGATDTKVGSAEDLKLQGQQVLEGGLAELKGDLSSSDFMELFDKTLTNFGNIFNEGIPALEKTGADVSAVTEAVKKNQDAFEQAFAVRAAEIVNLEADQLLEAGLAELKETAAADMDKLFDKTLTHFGTIFNEVLPELDSLSVDTSKMMDYTKAKQDEFEKAFEAKKGGVESSGAPGSAEDLKLQGQQVLEGGLAELKGGISSSDFMELFDKTLTNFGNIFNEGIPALEKTGADVSAVTEAVKKNQDAFEQAFALRAAEIVNLEADQILEAGLAELKETAAADMDKLFDKTLTHFGTIFNEVLPELDSLSVDTSKMMDYTKGKQDEFEKAFEAKKGGGESSGAPGSAEDLKLQGQQVLEGGLAELKGDLSSSDFMELFDKTLTNFGNIFNEGIPALEKTGADVSAVTEAVKKNQDAFEQAFALRAAEIVKLEADQLLEAGLAELKETAPADMDKLFDKTLTHFGTIFNEVLPELDSLSVDTSKMMDYTKAKQDEFEKAFEAKKGGATDTKVGSAEDLKLQGQQVLEGGLAELKGGISSSKFMELFDKTLTNFGNIFNEGIPALEKTGADVSAVTEAVKKNQDEFEQAFALRAAEIVNLEADQILEAGLAELKETAPADMDKLFDKTLTHFGTIFNEVLPELDSLSVDTSKMMDYTKAKQDEFEKAFEAKKGGATDTKVGSAEDLKLQGQQVLEGGLAELKGDLSSSDFMELFDKTLTNFGNIFNEGIPALEKTGADVSAVTEAVKKNQDAFEQAFAVRAAEIVNLEAGQLLEAGLAELKETAAADMDKLFDKTLTHFGTIFNEVLPELDSLSVDTSKMMDYTKAKQDEFEKAFEAKNGGATDVKVGSAEDLKLQGQQVLEGGLAEIKGDISSSKFMELFDKTLTNFGNIFNEGIPALEKTGADVSAVTEAVKKNQDAFEQAFALRAAEIVNLEADQLLEAGLAELKETAAADMDKLFDKTLTHFGTIFNEVLPELDSLSVDTSKMMDYTKGKQDEFEKAFEAKKGGGESSGAPGSAEDLKLQGQQVLEGGLAELKGDLSSSDFMELFDKTLTNFGNIFNEGISALEKTGVDVSAVTEAVKKNQDAFEQAFALRAAEIVKLEADQLLEAGLAELKETAAADMDKLFDKTLTHFGTIFNEVLPELDSLSVDTSKMMDYTKGKQDEFEKAFEAKNGGATDVKVGSAEDLKLQGQQVLEGGLAEIKGDISSSKFMELFDKTLTNFGNIFNEGIPALEKTGADVSAVTEAVKKNQDAFEQAFALRAAEIVNLEADQILEGGLAELKETAAADMDKLFDKTLTHFGTIFNEVLPELDSLSVDTSKMMDYSKGKQDEFEKAFEGQNGGVEDLGKRVEKLKKRVDKILGKAMNFLKEDLPKKKMDKLFDKVLTTFNKLVNEDASKLDEENEKIIFDYSRAAQDKFEKAFEEKKD